MTVADKQYCTFFIDDLYCGIEVLQVQEVLRTQQMTVVPLSGPEVAGLINLRGQIVTAIDLRLRLGLRPRGPDDPPMNVVVKSKNGPIALLVDDIDDVIEPDPALWEAPPETLVGAAAGLLEGVFKLEHRLLLILDTERTVDVGP